MSEKQKEDPRDYFPAYMLERKSEGYTNGIDLFVGAFDLLFRKVLGHPMPWEKANTESILDALGVVEGTEERERLRQNWEKRRRKLVERMGYKWEDFKDR